MSDSDDEVLSAIAFRGNLVPHIKEEDDTDAENDEETKSIETIQCSNLTWTPLVYTRKLDAMNTFRNIEKYTFKDASCMIEIESKPQYKQVLPNKRECYDSDKDSFKILCSRINKLNENAKLVKKRNRELIKMCKPFRIILTDICSSLKPKQIRKPSNTSQNKNVSGDVEHIDSVLLDAKPLNIFSKQAKSLELKSYIALEFEDHLTQDKDIYIINPAKDICYFKRNSFNNLCSMNTYRTESSEVFKVCCWVKREIYVKELIDSGIVNTLFTSFMRKQHLCSELSCKCCCVLKRTMPMQSSVTFSKNTEKSFYRNSVPHSKVLRKAYTYISNINNNACVSKENDKPINCLKNAVIMIKYTDKLLYQTGNAGENYEIDLKGKIFNHIKLNELRSLPEERALFEKSDKAKRIARQYFSYDICCWYKREEVIGNIKDLAQNNVLYMRNRHLCEIDLCECCCRPSTTLLPVTTSSTQVIQTKIRNRSKIPQKRKQRTKIPDKATQENNMWQNCQRVFDTKIREECVNITETKATLEHINVAELPPQDDSVHNIYNKLKELKLSVNHDGKLVANISTAPEKLQTHEIIVLSDILKLASKQMKELGLSPEEFCYRVNSRSYKSKTFSEPVLPTLTHSKLQPPPLIPIQKKNTKVTQKQAQYNTLCSNNITIPKTTDLNKHRLLYETMSELSMLRNECMAKVYKMQFRTIDNFETYKLKSPVQEIMEVSELLHDAKVQKKRKSRIPKSKERPPLATEMAIITKKVAKKTYGPSKSKIMSKIEKLNSSLSILSNVSKPLEPTPGPSQPLPFENNYSIPIPNINNLTNVGAPLPVGNSNTIPMQHGDDSNVLSFTNKLNTSVTPNIATPTNGNIFVYLNGALIPLQTVIHPNGTLTVLTPDVQNHIPINTLTQNQIPESSSTSNPIEQTLLTQNQIPETASTSNLIEQTLLKQNQIPEFASPNNPIEQTALTQNQIQTILTQNQIPETPSTSNLIKQTPLTQNQIQTILTQNQIPETASTSNPIKQTQLTQNQIQTILTQNQIPETASNSNPIKQTLLKQNQIPETVSTSNPIKQTLLTQNQIKTLLTQNQIPETGSTSNLIKQTPMLTVNNGVLMPPVTQHAMDFETREDEPEDEELVNLSDPQIKKKTKSFGPKRQKRSVSSMIAEYSQSGEAKKRRRDRLSKSNIKAEKNKDQENSKIALDEPVKFMSFQFLNSADDDESLLGL